MERNSAPRTPADTVAEAVEMAGWNLSDPSDVLDFAATLQATRAGIENRRAGRDRRAAMVWAIVGTIGGTVVTFEIPRFLEWLKLKGL